MKKIYERTKVELLELSVEDVLTTSPLEAEFSDNQYDNFFGTNIW